uniref:UDP-N-acetylmuramate--L-alanine ligase n=1 Tax=Eutreptiella gymnastica TaxID=73025 RepID=A0A7S4FXL0_9EUGL|mmetsp:Transcript_80630/g.134770  ORF Transcript_80630/g.134770 Transcript_80630/m.134770 type:complete len:326 (+) Transcript_80630:112-1089(+)
MSHSGVASAAAPGRTPAAQAALRLIQSGQPIAAHFIGICGAGMSGIAKVFLQQGHTVTGSDLARSGAAAELEALGAVVHIGHAAKHLGRPHVVVFTGAIPSGNPEYLRAQQEGLPVLHRSQALALLLCNRTAVAVSGSHGKTTSTAMVAVALRHLGADPSFVNGGVVMDVGSSAASGSGRMFVIEADESDKSFLNYPVDVAFITNVDFDHPDFFSGRDAYEDAFVEFATAARDAVVICLDDPGGRRVRARLTHRRVVGYGFAADADLRLLAVDASGPAASAAVCFAGQEHKVRLRVPGRHNAYNAVGALAVLTALACPPIPQGFA